MARPALPRSFVITLFTAASVLVAVYFAARSSAWGTTQRVTLAVAFLALAAVVYVADWYAHRRARQ